MLAVWWLFWCHGDSLVTCLGPDLVRSICCKLWVCHPQAEQVSRSQNWLVASVNPSSLLPRSILNHPQALASRSCPVAVISTRYLHPPMRCRSQWGYFHFPWAKHTQRCSNGEKTLTYLSTKVQFQVCVFDRCGGVWPLQLVHKALLGEFLRKQFENLAPHSPPPRSNQALVLRREQNCWTNLTKKIRVHVQWSQRWSSQIFKCAWVQVQLHSCSKNSDDKILRENSRRTFSRSRLGVSNEYLFGGNRGGWGLYYAKQYAGVSLSSNLVSWSWSAGGLFSCSSCLTVVKTDCRCLHQCFCCFFVLTQKLVEFCVPKSLHLVVSNLFVCHAEHAGFLARSAGSRCCHFSAIRRRAPCLASGLHWFLQLQLQRFCDDQRGLSRKKWVPAQSHSAQCFPFHSHNKKTIECSFSYSLNILFNRKWRRTSQGNLKGTRNV